MGTECNFCSLERIRERATRQDKVVTLRNRRGGVDVYVHDPDVEVPNAVHETARTRYGWAGWFMELGSSCGC